MRETTKRTRPGIEACPPAAIRMFFFFFRMERVRTSRPDSFRDRRAQTTYRDLVYYQARVTRKKGERGRDRDSRVLLAHARTHIYPSFFSPTERVSSSPAYVLKGGGLGKQNKKSRT
jgi:hypothetical protein